MPSPDVPSRREPIPRPEFIGAANKAAHPTASKVVSLRVEEQLLIAVLSIYTGVLAASRRLGPSEVWRTTGREIFRGGVVFIRAPHF